MARPIAGDKNIDGEAQLERGEKVEAGRLPSTLEDTTEALQAGRKTWLTGGT